MKSLVGRARSTVLTSQGHVETSGILSFLRVSDVDLDMFFMGLCSNPISLNTELN